MTTAAGGTSTHSVSRPRTRGQRPWSIGIDRPHLAGHEKPKMAVDVSRMRRDGLPPRPRTVSGTVLPGAHHRQEAAVTRAPASAHSGHLLALAPRRGSVRSLSRITGLSGATCPGSGDPCRALVGPRRATRRSTTSRACPGTASPDGSSGGSRIGAPIGSAHPAGSDHPERTGCRRSGCAGSSLCRKDGEMPRMRTSDPSGGRDDGWRGRYGGCDGNEGRSAGGA
jgi:hypothetical protein